MGCLDNLLENMLGMIGWATVSRKISFHRNKKIKIKFLQMLMQLLTKLGARGQGKKKC